MLLTIPFAPLAKRAHNAAISYKGTRPFPVLVDPDAERKRDLAKFIATELKNQLPEKPFSGAVGVHLMMFFQIPESATNKEREFRIQNPWAFDKPLDVDNMAKLYLDILQTEPLRGVIFSAGKGIGQGDSIVSQLVVDKFWTETYSRVEIEAKQLEPISISDPRI